MHNDNASLRLNNRLLPVANAFGLILVLVVNALAVFLPLNGKTTKQLSDQYPNLFVPAGITFSIWSVIYLLLIAFVIYQFNSLSQTSKNEDAISTVNKTGWLFFISCLANASWICAWHYEMVSLSVCIMLILLITLIGINMELNIFRFGQGWKQDLLVQIPFSIYLGWISIATIANISALLVHYNWDGMGITALNWTTIMIKAGTVIAVFMLMQRNNFYFALVVLWAFYGIILKRQQEATPESQTIIHTCITVMIIIVVTALLKLFIGKKYSTTS